jgi:hypothetical protein
MGNRKILSVAGRQPRNFNDLPVSQSAIVARRAVLWPLAKELGTNYAQADFCASFVLRAWQQRVVDLAVTDYSPPRPPLQPALHLHQLHAQHGAVRRQ